MPKEFAVPPVVFPSGVTAASPSSTMTSGNLQQRRVPTAPFQPQRPASSIPFMSFDIGSAYAASTSTPFQPPYLRSDAVSSLFLDEPPLLEELEINPTLIWRKTRAILNPFRVNPVLHDDPDLSGPFLYYMAFALFQLLAGKVQFGVLLGWIAISSIFLYSILNFLSGKNGNLDLYRCFSVVGYCLMPIVVFSAVSLFLPASGARFAVGGVFVVWATRVCSRLLAENATELLDHLLFHHPPGASSLEDFSPLSSIYTLPQTSASSHPICKNSFIQHLVYRIVQMAENVSGGGHVIGLVEMEEEEEELFEINLEAVNQIPPPEYFWGSLVLATGEALLANCLMPISDLSTAIPVHSNNSYEALPVVSLSGVLMVQGGDGFTGKLQF